MTMAGRSGECLHSLFHTEHEEPQDRLHVRVGLVHGGLMASPHNTHPAWLPPPTLVSGVPTSRARVRASCLDLTLLENLLHGVGQGEVSLAALRQAAAPGPGSVALVGLGAQLAKVPHGQLQDLPTVRGRPRLL